eukprot:2661138-Pleurochrysis_carterae.AAC.3
MALQVQLKFGTCLEVAFSRRFRRIGSSADPRAGAASGKRGGAAPASRRRGGAAARRQQMSLVRLGQIQPCPWISLTCLDGKRPILRRVMSIQSPSLGWEDGFSFSTRQPCCKFTRTPMLCLTVHISIKFFAVVTRPIQTAASGVLHTSLHAVKLLKITLQHNQGHASSAMPVFCTRLNRCSAT